MLVTLVTAGAFTHVVFRTDSLRFRTLCHKTHIFRIVNVVTAIEYLGPISDPFEQIAQTGNRTVVQVWRAQPDAVEKSGDITARFVLHQTAPFDAEIAHDLVRLDGSLLAPGF